MTRDKIIARLINESREDFLQLAEVAGYAARDTGRHENGEDDPSTPLPIKDPRVIKSNTLALVRDLLITKTIEAGELSEGGKKIDPWRIPVEEVIVRIDREWSALGRMPNLYEIVWLGPCIPADWPHGVQ